MRKFIFYNERKTFVSVIICMLFPAFISLGLYSALERRQLRPQESIVFWGICVAVINTIMYSADAWLWGNAGSVLTVYSFTAGFSAKYLLLSVCLAVAAALLWHIIRQNIRVKFESVRRREDSEK